MSAFSPTPWPTLGLPTPGQLAFARQSEQGLRELTEFLQKRERLIELEKLDPLRYGYEPATWKRSRELLKVADDLLILGGNRAGKTTFAAKYVVETLLASPGARAWCLHSTDKSSIAMQQPEIYRHLPPELRDLGKKGKVTNICYTQKNGFSESSFVLPSGAQCWFMNYAQDVKVIEGGELNIIWTDELVPHNWVETLRYRLLTRRGKFLLTFTPTEGYSLVVKDYVAGARISEVLPSPLLADTINVPGCPRGTMPYVLEPLRANQRVICFHSSFNPYSPYAELEKVLKGRPGPEIRTRAYGWADKLAGNVFPKFGDVNIVPREAIPKEGTNWLVCDPGGVKNWFMVWLRVDEQGRIFAYREWPDAGLGEWALASEKADGRPGPAQKAEGGRGIVGYKRLILDLEAGEEIEGRLIDPRGGGMGVPGMEEGTSIVEMMIEEQRDREGAVTGPSLEFIPAPTMRRVDQGVELINTWLDYNPEAPLNALNAPRFYVWEGCRNLIYSLREWTGVDGDKGASKDPIDCLRYAAQFDIQHVGKGPRVWGGGSY